MAFRTCVQLENGAGTVPDMNANHLAGVRRAHKHEACHTCSFHATTQGIPCYLSHIVYSAYMLPTHTNGPTRA